MGHHLRIQVSPLVRRVEDHRAGPEADASQDDPAVRTSQIPQATAATPWRHPAVTPRTPGHPGTGAPTASAGPPTNRAWLATASIENKAKDNWRLSLKPGESTSCFVLFGPVDARSQIFVPKRIRHRQRPRQPAAASGIDFGPSTRPGNGVASPNYEAEPDPGAVPNASERYTKALDGLYTGSKDRHPRQTSPSPPTPPSLGRRRQLHTVFGHSDTPTAGR